MSDRNPNKRGGPDVLGEILKDTPYAHKSEIQRLQAALSEIRALPDVWDDIVFHPEVCSDQLRAILEKYDA